MRSAFLLVLALCLASACSSSDSKSEVSGVVVSVRSSGLTEVELFTVRDDEHTYEFVVTDATELAFPPAHLNEHRVSGAPVRVVYESRDDRLYAISVDDA